MNLSDRASTSSLPQSGVSFMGKGKGGATVIGKARSHWSEHKRVVWSHFSTNLQLSRPARLTAKHMARHSIILIMVTTKGRSACVGIY